MSWKKNKMFHQKSTEIYKINYFGSADGEKLQIYEKTNRY